MKKLFIIIFLSLFLFSCWNSENKISKNDYNPEEWECVLDDSLMYSKKKNWYEIWWAQKWCSCAEIELLDLKLFGEVSPKFEADFWCKKSKISEIFKIKDKNSKKDNCDDEVEDAIAENEEKMKKMYEAIDYADKEVQASYNIQNNNSRELKPFNWYMTENVKLRKWIWMNSEVLKIIKKWESITVFPEARNSKDWFEWTIVSDNNWSTWWAIIDYIKIFDN